MSNTTRCFMCKKAKKRSRLVEVFAHGSNRVVLCCSKHPGMVEEHKRYLRIIATREEEATAAAAIRAYYKGEII